jgi:ketosteroid isomerase-like protein
MKRLLAVLLVMGCSPRNSSSVVTSPTPTITMEAFAADSIAGVLVARAFSADAALLEPDSLYIEDAEIIANGEPRADAPRFAGIGLDGRVQIGSSRFTISGSFVYGTVEYRWVPRTVGELASEGRASFVLGRNRAGAWRILHLHSSTPPTDVETPRPVRPDTTEHTGRY